MNGKIFAGREISVVVAAETRKRPEEMCHRARVRGPLGYGGRRSSYYEHSRSRSLSRSGSPRHPSGSKNRYRSRSYSPAPRRRGDYSVSPSRRQADHPRSPGGPRKSKMLITAGLTLQVMLMLLIKMKTATGIAKMRE